MKSERQRIWNPAHLSALLREQTIRRLPPFWLRYGMDPYGPLEWAGRLAHIDVEELLQRWPRSVPQRIDRTLCNFAYLSPTGGHHIVIRSSDDNCVAFAETLQEAIFHRDALVAQGYLERPRFDSGDPNATLCLTANGWARFEDLTRNKTDAHNPVFVAMSFGGESQRQAMADLFRKGIEPAIQRAGYRATRVDLVEHNEWIMDKVFGDIRLAPFVVADFTDHRNGVYLEAGFARGLGKPVIHTCRKDELDKAHFDTKQMNHVVWTTPEDFQDRLYHRIIGSIGLGPYPAPSAGRAT